MGGRRALILLSAVGMACVTWLTTFALWLGYDSAIYGTAVSAITFLVGVFFGKGMGGKT